MNYETVFRQDRSSHLALLAAAIGVACLLFGGCSSAPRLTHTGFLSDYSNLQEESASRVRYVSPRAREYRKFIVEPVKVLIPGEKLSQDDRRKAMEHFDESLREAIESSGMQVVVRPGPGVGRLRVAITDVAQSTWWQKVHPASRMMGAGTGGAAMEGEVIDSMTGEQIGAVIQAGSGNQFDFTAFSTLADVMSAIDRWTEIFADRLREIHAPTR